ncbi:MAG TPA: hypothetical protein VGO87_11185 [Acidimicrobiia bacterium]
MDPTPDHLNDETLSALLDGDPTAAAPDVGAHLGACDRCAGRQAELAGARAALAAAPVEPLDELSRRRLLAAAVKAAPPQRRWAQRHPALIGSAAAVILAVLVGVPFVVNHGGSSAGKTLSAAAPEAAGDYLGDLGDLTDRDQLRLRLSGAADNSLQRDFATSAPGEPAPSPAAGATPSAAPVAAPVPSGGAGLAGAPAAAPGGGATPSTTLGPQGRVGGSTGAAKAAGPAADSPYSSSQPYSSEQQSATADRDRADVDTCVAALLNGPAKGGRLTRSGVGTWRGRPAVVAAFELNGGTVAFVTARSGCAVLDRFTY